MGILVFLPEFDGDVQAEMKARGLGDLLEPGIEPIPVRTSKGPTGGPGMLCGFETSDPREYNATTQTWLEAPPDGELPKGRYWVGYANNAKPGPEVLQRRELIDGEPVLLCDNGVWAIPCAEYAPKRLTRDPESGKEVRVARPEFSDWVAWANALYAMFVSDAFSLMVEKQKVVHIPDGMTFAALTLSKNYRVNTDVVDLLELIDEYKAFDIAKVATGIALLEKLLPEKKNTEP